MIATRILIVCTVLVAGIVAPVTPAPGPTPAPPFFATVRLPPYNADDLATMMIRLNATAHWPMHGTAPLYEGPAIGNIGMTIAPQVQPAQVRGPLNVRYFGGYYNSGFGSIPWDPVYKTSEFTVSAWIYRFNGYWGWDLPILSDRKMDDLYCGNLNADSSGFWLGINSGNRIHFQVHLGINQALTYIQGPVISASRWYHITATRANGMIQLFVDGTRVARQATSSYSVPYSPLLVGSDSYCFHNPANKFYGYIGDVALFNRVVPDDTPRQMAMFRNSASDNTCQDNFLKCESIRTGCATLAQCSDSGCVTALAACNSAYASCMSVEVNCAAQSVACPDI